MMAPLVAALLAGHFFAVASVAPVIVTAPVVTAVAAVTAPVIGPAVAMASTSSFEAISLASIPGLHEHELN